MLWLSLLRSRHYNDIFVHVRSRALNHRPLLRSLHWQLLLPDYMESFAAGSNAQHYWNRRFAIPGFWQTQVLHGKLVFPSSDVTRALKFFHLKSSIFECPCDITWWEKPVFHRPPTFAKTWPKPGHSKPSISIMLVMPLYLLKLVYISRLLPRYYCFLKFGPTPASFIVCFQSFPTNITIFTTNICEKCPFSIPCWDSNPRPSEYESPPITTRRGLSPKPTLGTIVFQSRSFIDFFLSWNLLHDRWESYKSWVVAASICLLIINSPWNSFSSPYLSYVR